MLLGFKLHVSPVAGVAALAELRLHRGPAADRGQALPAVLRQAQGTTHI